VKRRMLVHQRDRKNQMNLQICEKRAFFRGRSKPFFFSTFHVMSIPLNLFEAFELLRRQQQKPKKNDSRKTVVDILGIVSKITTSPAPRNSAPSRSSDRSRRCQIWLLDESTASAESPFLLRGSSEVARVIKEKIKPGDILRFNGVELKSFGGALQFQFCTQDPEPGLNWLRLGSVNNQGRIDDDAFDVSEDDQLPKSMITCRERLMELANWYSSKRRKMTINPPNALPTRKRRLDEIHSSVGFISNILVRVVDIRFIPFSKSKIGYFEGEMMVTRSRLPPSSVFATFTDDSGVVMTFVDSAGRYSEKLKAAQCNNNKMKVEMTNISTDYQSSLIAGLPNSSFEIILVPTETTTSRLISVEEDVQSSNVQGTSDVGVTELEPQERIHETDITLRSCVRDICVDGLSLKTSQSAFSSASKYLQAIIGKNGNYKRAIISLDENHGQICNTRIPSTSSVLKILCGGLDVDELVSENKLCMYSMGFLKSILDEDVVLDWTLHSLDCGKDNNFEITKATLHRVPK